jgi:hypothetical protein
MSSKNAINARLSSAESSSPFSASLLVRQLRSFLDASYTRAPTQRVITTAILASTVSLIAVPTTGQT